MRGPAAAAICLAVAGLGVADVRAQERASYSFYRNGVAVGHHVVQTSGSAGRHTVDIDSQVAVRLGGQLTVFRYAHHSRETWDGERLISLESRTDDDGKSFRVLASAGAGGMVVRATVPEVENASLNDRMMGFAPTNSERLVEQVLPADLLPTSWSHARILKQSRLLNSQTGNLQQISVQQLGTDVVQTGQGQIPASRYRLTGMITTLELWYDNRGRWLKSAFRGRDGSAIEMVLER